MIGVLTVAHTWAIQGLSLASIFSLHRGYISMEILLRIIPSILKVLNMRAIQGLS